MFWGRIEGMKQDYYICLGVTFTDKFEFPEKRFYWATSTDFKFSAFPAELNYQHQEKVDSIKGSFRGEPNHVLI
jgi:radial spoke head protein 9